MKSEHLPSKNKLVVEKILDYILKNNLKVGDKIPNEYTLATILEVGRGTIREGVRELISRNILYIKRGDGTYISEKKGVLKDPLGLALIKDKSKLLNDMLDIRFLIEPYIAQQSAIKSNKDEKDKIEKLCDDVETLIKNGENHLDKDVEFHKAIAESCGNDVMARLLPVINQSIYLFGNATNMKLKNVTIETHREIVEAIKNNNAKMAHDAMYLHLVHNRRAITKLINKID